MPAVDRVSPISPAQAAEIALAHYGVGATAERLASEHDDTFRLAGADGAARLLKISVAPPVTDSPGFVVSADTGEPSAELAAAIVNGMRDRHVLISATGPGGHVLKVRPPLPFARPQADQFLEAFSAVLATL